MREPCYKCKFEDKPITAEPCDHCSDVYIKTGDHPAFQYAKPITNYDRIISKTPEELAEWIEDIAPHQSFAFFLNGKTWLDWLKQEATKGGD
jgi:hypothetical protein